MTVKGKNGMTDKKDKGITVLHSPKSVFKAFSSFFNSKFSILNSQFGFKGFSLIEMLVVIIIAGILAAIAIPSYMDMVKDHKLTQYGTNMEYLVKHAKIIAMEKTINVGVCVNSVNRQLLIYDVTTNRSATACSGSTILNSMTIESGDASSHNISITGSNSGDVVTIDPRGITIVRSGNSGTGHVCLTNGRKYYKVVFDRASIRTQEGTGDCT